ncbi:MAG: hypothetical protein CVT93_01925 [Bacteroidetes bacterium HGW-Bacteroidetes-10]|nr:MAG: hypothetical protein CVT93_01925 [Bacteroidetes bacterium HGW-Bacteroidetes-10]
MRKFLLILIFASLALPLTGQMFSGRVIDKDGRPVPHATVYILEIKSGISADAAGEFTVRISPGTYNCEISSLGYKRSRLSVSTKGEDISKTIVLEETSYELNAVHFSGRGEERGSAIMRRAIAMAPRYRYQLASYEAENYLKGTMKITRLPAIFKLKSLKGRSKLLLNQLFLVESFSHISYKTPGKYTQTVKAYKSTIPDEMSGGDIDLLFKSSIYDPEIMDMVSPLSPNAMSYYRFVYQGVTNESGHVVNKILVVPRKGNAKLLAGHLYIADETWNVTYAELATVQSGIRANIKINYNEVSSNVFLPTSYNVGVNIDMMGITGEGRYFSSVAYKSIKENSASRIPASVKVPSADTNFTSKEAGRVARETEKAINPLPAETSLEIKKSDPNTITKVDSTAKSRDSLYWLEVRKVPLRNEEVKSYLGADSIRREFKKIEQDDSVRSQNGGKGGNPLQQIVYGHKYKIAKGLSFSFGGLSKVVGDFNFVDGYQLGQNFSLEYSAIKNTPVILKPAIYYSTSRKKLLWDVNLNVRYAPLHNGIFSIQAGSGSQDISSNNATSRFINSYASFFFGMNPVKFMANDFVKISNEIDIASGLRGKLILSAERRSVLFNGGEKSLFGKIPATNIPENIFNPLFDNHGAYTAEASLFYTPRYYYRITEGKKQYVRSLYPTFGIKYRGAFSGGDPMLASFGAIETGIRQTIRLNIYSTIGYSVSAGTFLNSKKLYIPDFRHFAASDMMVSEAEFENNFMMLDNYKYSTPGSWAQLMINYHSDYILLKYLSFLNNPLIGESLHLKSLWLTDRGIHHTEVGYSIGLSGVIKAGVFAGFGGWKFNSAGFRISIPLIKELK